MPFTLQAPCEYHEEIRKSRFLTLAAPVDSAEQAREIILARDELGLPNSILVTAPIPEEFEIDRETMERAIDQAMKKAFSAGISGKETTPFLLSEVSRITEGRSVTANIALLENNARIAAEIAVSLFS